MRRRTWLPTLLAIVVLAVVSVPTQEKGGQEEFGPYEPVENWPKPLPDGPDGVKHAGHNRADGGEDECPSPLRDRTPRRMDA